MAAERIRDAHGQMPVTRFALRTAIRILALSSLLMAVASTAFSQEVRIIDRFAGGSNGDGGPATDASIHPAGAVFDSAGNLYIADTENHRVRRVDASTGIVTTIAGVGSAAAGGDGGPAVDAYLNAPVDVAVDSAGNIFISDRGNHRVRRVDRNSGIITTVAGNGTAGFGGDNGPATAALLRSPGGIAIASDGSIYVADTSNNRIRRIANGQIQTIAGNGTFGFSGDGGLAVTAKLALPSDVTIGSGGEIYIADFANQRIRRVVDGRISTIAGSGQFSICDNLPALQACFRNPIAMEYDPTDGVLYVADAANHRLRRVPVDGGLVTTIAGTGTDGYNGDGILAVLAWLHGPSGVAVHPNRGIFVSDQFSNRVRRIPRGAAPIIQTVVGNGDLPYGGDGGPALGAKFNGPAGLTHDAAGRIYVADTINNRIRRIDTNGVITTIAGNGEGGFSGDGGQATAASIKVPSDIAVDRAGNVYFSDRGNNRIRRVTPAGIISTILGNGTPQSTGDGGSATAASTAQPSSLAIYENDSGSKRFLYLIESAQNKVRVVDLNTNRVDRFAGTGTFGFAGDGGPAANARLAVPQDVTTDSNGNVYIADTFNHRVRRVSNGIISTLAGTGSFGYGGDGGPAQSAKLASPGGVAVGPLGHVLIADVANYRVRIVDPTGTINTAVGTGVETGRIDGEGGDPDDDIGNGGPATQASVKTIASITFDAQGNAFLVDNPSGTIRWVRDLSGAYGDPLPGLGSVFGDIRYANSELPVSGVTVQAFGPTEVTARTGSDGSYSLTDVAHGEWWIEPTKTGGVDSSSVISPLDAAYVLQTLVGLRELSDAQRLACDVTGDGELSPLDATRILQSALTGEPFPAATSCGSEWLFLPAAAKAPNQTQIAPLLAGGNSCNPGGIVLDPLRDDLDNQDFIAVVIGDCTANWTPNGGAKGATTSALARRDAGSGSAIVIEAARRSRRKVRIPISIEGTGSFNAVQIDLTFDAESLRPTVIKGRGAARNAIVGWRETRPGTVSIALASGYDIIAPARTALVLEFEVTDTSSRTTRGFVRSARAQIDERSAGVRVLRQGRRR